MNILIDTCVFLWLLIDDKKKLSETFLESFSDMNNTIYLSPVSVWEILVKHKTGKLPLPDNVIRDIVELRENLLIQQLPVMEKHVLMLKKLPDLHQDPFDRLLICQALSDSLTFATPDQTIKEYPVNYIW